MLRNKSQKSEVRSQKLNLKSKIFNFTLWFYLLPFTFYLLCYAEEQFIYNAKNRRNPFIPLVTADGRLLKLEEEAKEGLSLEGIIYDKNSLSYAIVNGTIVKIGDKICEYQVLKIEEKKVTFIKDGQIMEVELKEEP